ncbi:MAG: ribulose-phosphate 3-epimerase [Bacteroidales bacterium]|nr:ribulose-phosphate 3-epimerase [Bacteroidales bacterium]MBQ9597865.1 ribulose-phosphate 3-epimerase [Bacteroidales bacterium]
MSALIAPSLLAADFLHLEKDVRLVNEYADLFHMDVMDGRFVPNISFGFPVIDAVHSIATKPLDVHLMIRHPQAYIERFCKSGAYMLSFHLDATRDDPEPILGMILEQGVKPGLAINPNIPVEKLFPYLDICDFVLIMSVYAGFGGQAFIEDTYGRVERTREEIVSRGLSTHIEVDGGVSPKNASRLISAGADILVAGSSVFRAEDPAAAIAAMRG